MATKPDSGETRSTAELAEAIMRPILNAAARRLAQAMAEIDKTRIAPLEATIKALLAKPHGCIYCDYGVLRDTPTARKFGHDDDCGFAMADAIGFAA
jgi:hypothetical protein